MKRYKWLIAWGLTAAVLCGAVFAVTFEPPKERETFTVKYGDVKDTLELSGRVTAAQSEYVYSSSAGKVAEVFVSDGETVAQGQPVFRLDSAQMERELENLKAQAEEYQLNLLAQKEYAARTKAELGIMQAQSYYAEYSSMSEAVDEFLNQLKVQDAVTVSGRILGTGEEDETLKQLNEQIEKLEESVEKSVITAPIDGEISLQELTEGGYITASAPCAVIQGTSRLELTVPVHENDYEEVIPGQKIYVGSTVIGEVTHKSALAANSDGTVSAQATISLNSGNYNINSRLDVTLITQSAQDVLIIPALWCLKDEGGNYVNVLNADGAEEKRYVSLGVSNGQYTQVLNGLSENEQIISPFEL